MNKHRFIISGSDVNNITNVFVNYPEYSGSVIATSSLGTELHDYIDLRNGSNGNTYIYCDIEHANAVDEPSIAKEINYSCDFSEDHGTIEQYIKAVV